MSSVFSISLSGYLFMSLYVSPLCVCVVSLSAGVVSAHLLFASSSLGLLSVSASSCLYVPFMIAG